MVVLSVKMLLSKQICQKCSRAVHLKALRSSCDIFQGFGQMNPLQFISNLFSFYSKEKVEVKIRKEITNLGIKLFLKMFLLMSITL